MRKDPTEAVKWWRRAAAQWDADAQHALGAACAFVSPFPYQPTTTCMHPLGAACAFVFVPAMGRALEMVGLHRTASAHSLKVAYGWFHSSVGSNTGTSAARLEGGMRPVGPTPTPHGEYCDCDSPSVTSVNITCVDHIPCCCLLTMRFDDGATPPRLPTRIQSILPARKTS